MTQNIFDRLVYQLKSNGMSDAHARATAAKKLKQSGNMNEKGLTAKGKQRSAMTPAERAKDRAAKEKGGKPSDYKYNKYNNSAVKGKVNSKVKRRK